MPGRPDVLFLTWLIAKTLAEFLRRGPFNFYTVGLLFLTAARAATFFAFAATLFRRRRCRRSGRTSPRGQRLTVDELAGPLEPGREVVHLLHVGRDLLRRSLVHGHVVDRSRGTAVVLEQQILGQRVSPR